MALAMAYGLDKKEYKELSIFFRDFPKLIESAVSNAAIKGREWIILRTPIDTGEARKSYSLPKKVNGLTYIIASDTGAGSKYTPFLEYGTGIYGLKKRAITAKPGKYFVFPIVKKNTIKAWVRTKTIKGMRPVKMMERTAPLIMKQLIKNIKDNITEAYKKGGV